MNRCILPFLVSVVTIVVISNTGRPNMSTRTLSRDELARSHGGEQGCCFLIGDCLWEKDCAETNPGFDCRLLGRQDIEMSGNRSGCFSTSNPTQWCDEAPDQTVCRLRARCRTVHDAEGGAFCVTDFGLGFTEEFAPEYCFDDCL